MRTLSLILLSLLSTVALAQTQIPVTGPGSVSCVFTPAATPPPVVVTTPPVVTPPSVAGFWVFNNGVFNWGGDYSWSVSSVNYKDTSGVPFSGPYDIKITPNGPWNGFLPYAGGIVPLWNFDASPYKTFTIAIKPSTSTQNFQIYFVKVGDVSLPDQCTIHPNELAQYGPVPKAGVWGIYNPPLARFCIGAGNDPTTGKPFAGGTAVYKVAVQEDSGGSASWFVGQMGFQ